MHVAAATYPEAIEDGVTHDEGPSAAPPDEGEHLGPVLPRPLPPRGRRLIVLAATVAVGTSVVGSAFSPYLLTHYPIVLLALAPEPRHVVLTAGVLDGWILVPLVVTRRVLGLLALYAFGWAFGQSAIVFIEERFGATGRFLRWCERSLARYGIGLVLVAPTPTLAVLSGMAGTSIGWTTLAMTVGQCVYVGLTFAFGSAITELTAPVLAWLAAHVVEATLACVAIVVLWQAWARWRRHRRARAAPAEPSSE